MSCRAFAAGAVRRFRWLKVWLPISNPLSCSQRMAAAPASPPPNGSALTYMLATGRNPGWVAATSRMMRTPVPGAGVPSGPSVIWVGSPSSNVSTTGCAPAGMSMRPAARSAVVMGT
jgi:hypothetical protein